jgi:hypothetical protein
VGNLPEPRDGTCEPSPISRSTSSSRCASSMIYICASAFIAVLPSPG